MRNTDGLDIAGHLSILADGDPIDVAFRGSVVILTLPSLRTGLGLRKRLGLAGRREWIDRVQATLASAGLELEIRVRSRQVARLAAGSRRGWLATRLGLAPLELKVRAILAEGLGL